MELSQLPVEPGIRLHGVVDAASALPLALPVTIFNGLRDAGTGARDAQRRVPAFALGSALPVMFR